MQEINKFFQSFSNRELALLVWIILTLVLLFVFKSTRSDVINIFKTLFVKNILIILCSYFIYLLCLITMLSNIKLWDSTLLKDTLIWIFSFGVLLIFKIKNANSSNYFKQIIKEAIKWTIIIEFVANFYTFNFLVELVLIPLLGVLGFLIAKSATNIKYKRVKNILQLFLNFVYSTVVIFLIYQLFKNSGSLFTTDNLKSFLLPIILTLLFIPFVYVLALYYLYEQLFVRIPFLTNYNKSLELKLKKGIFTVANVDIDRLVNISKNLYDSEQVYKSNLIEYLKSICKNNILQNEK